MVPIPHLHFCVLQLFPLLVQWSEELVPNSVPWLHNQKNESRIHTLTKCNFLPLFEHHFLIQMQDKSAELLLLHNFPRGLGVLLWFTQSQPVDFVVHILLNPLTQGVTDDSVSGRPQVFSWVLLLHSFLVVLGEQLLMIFNLFIFSLFHLPVEFLMASLLPLGDDRYSLGGKWIVHYLRYIIQIQLDYYLRLVMIQSKLLVDKGFVFRGVYRSGCLRSQVRSKNPPLDCLVSWEKLCVNPETLNCRVNHHVLPF